MNSADQPAPQKRIVHPPSPETAGPETSVLSVFLDEDEEVIWHWTHREGRSVVTGYEIVKRPPAAPPAH
ncbi:MAG: hypothetical protein JO250_07540 [Armatimonadetes bacterium]|nr:hypothetical protein [Armatimonadota bacterium]